MKDRLIKFIKFSVLSIFTSMILISNVSATSLYSNSYRVTGDALKNEVTSLSSTPLLMRSIGIVYLVCFCIYQIKLGFIDKNNDYKRTSIASIIITILFYFYAFKELKAFLFVLVGIIEMLLFIYNEKIFINRQKKAYKFRKMVDNPCIYGTLLLISELLVLDVPFNNVIGHKIIASILMLLFFAFYIIKIKSYYPRYKKLKNKLMNEGEI